MKEEEARVEHSQHQMLVYVEKPDGSYGSMQTGSWMTSNMMDDFREKQHYFHETYLQQIRAGEISPIAYYMNIMELAAPDVAVRLRLSTRAVRRHMTGKGFARIRMAHLVRYAELFGVPVARLFMITDPFDRSVRLEFRPTGIAAVSELRLQPAQNPARPQ